MAVAELGRLAALGPLGSTAGGYKTKAGELKFAVRRRTRRAACRCQAGAFSSLNSGSDGNLPGANPINGIEKAKGMLESLFYTDSGIPEEKIDPPTGLPKGMRPIGNKPRCPLCEAKGAVECATCSGTGLYVDSILESQGIIVKVRCLGCGGAGNHMCLKCGGRGHI